MESKDPFVQELISLWKSRNPEGSIYTASLYTMPVAFILLETSETEWTIRGTWTDEWCRGKGVASLILKNIFKDFVEDSKVHYIWVNITPGAEKFYTDRGFRIWGKRTDLDVPMSVGVFSDVHPGLEQTLFASKYKDRVEFFKNV